MTVTYKNPTGAQMASLPFMLYPNAYAQVQTAPFQNDEMGKAYPGGFSEGGIVLTEITADGQPVQTRLKNDDETLLEIDLPQPACRRRHGGNFLCLYRAAATLPGPVRLWREHI